MPEVNEPMLKSHGPMNPKLLDLVRAGAPVAEAIRIALAPSRDRKDVRSAIPRFADRHRLSPKATADAIYGGRPAPESLLEALAKDLGGSPEQFRELLRYGDRLGLEAIAKTA